MMVKADSAWGKVICFQMNSIKWRETNTKSSRAYITACFSGLPPPSISDRSNCLRADCLCWPFLLTPFPASVQALQKQHSELCWMHLLPGLLTGLFLTLPLKARQHFGFPSSLHPKALAHGWVAWLHPVVGYLEPAGTAVSGTKQLCLTSHGTVAVCAATSAPELGTLTQKYICFYRVYIIPSPKI